MPACGGNVRIETARLDRTGRAYEAYLRTERFLRAAVGVMVGFVLISPLTFVFVPLSYFTIPGEERRMSLVIVIAFAIGVFGLFLAILYLYFWALRAFAAGSLRAALIVLVFISLAADFPSRRLGWGHLHVSDC